jgi:ribonuclease T2
MACGRNRARATIVNVEMSLMSADKKSDWASLPAVDLVPDTRARLDKVMPGTQSMLERHEWIKHGTCLQRARQGSLFQAVRWRSADEVNGLGGSGLFAGHVGKEVKGSEIRAAFDSAFWRRKPVDRVRIACKKDGSRRLIVELTIGLAGPDGKLADYDQSRKGHRPRLRTRHRRSYRAAVGRSRRAGSRTGPQLAAESTAPAA